MRIIEVVADCGHVNTLQSIAEQYEVHDHWRFQPREETGRCICRMLVTPDKLQQVIDALQTALEKNRKLSHYHPAGRGHIAPAARA